MNNWIGNLCCYSWSSRNHTFCFGRHFDQNTVINHKRNSRSLRRGNKEEVLTSILPTSLLQWSRSLLKKLEANFNSSLRTPSTAWLMSWFYSAKLLVFSRIWQIHLSICFVIFYPRHIFSIESQSISDKFRCLFCVPATHIKCINSPTKSKKIALYKRYFCSQHGSFLWENPLNFLFVLSRVGVKISLLSQLADAKNPWFLR